MFTCSHLSNQDEGRLYVVFIDKQDNSMDKTEPFVTAIVEAIFVITLTTRQGKQDQVLMTVNNRINFFYRCGPSIHGTRAKS